MKCSAFFLLLSTAATAVAQEEVVVTGRGLDDRLGDRTLDVVTVDRDRIEPNASNRLESVLAEVAGLQQFRRSDSRSANPTSQGISLRGIGGNASSRALLVLDGVPQTDPFGGWVAFPAYAINRLGRVRVTRGGGAAISAPVRWRARSSWRAPRPISWRRWKLRRSAASETPSMRNRRRRWSDLTASRPSRRPTHAGTGSRPSRARTAALSTGPRPTNRRPQPYAASFG